MRKFLFHSNQTTLVIATIVCLYSLLSGCGMQAHTDKFSTKEGYLITISENATEEDTQWAKYLYNHLQKRANDSEMVAYGISARDMWNIIIQIDPSQKGFEIKRKNSDIKLVASNRSQMLWLQYQLMKRISNEDVRIKGSDLPPAIIQIKDTCGTFAFDYRSIYSIEGLNTDYTGVVGLDNFDETWGIWGHNLGKVLGANLERFYATTHGKKSDEQFCFSSSDIYQALEQYIMDTHGAKGGSRFVIAPNDNPIVCTCATCVDMGNTPQSATPAVTELVRRLAQRFPKHSFFTTSYLSTRKAPTEVLASNVGVIVSAIDLPFSSTVSDTPAAKQFIQQLKNWNKVTPNLYIWDYVSNFDDYLSPFPILKVAQQRMQFFRKNGINGVFLNGSGYSYSSFDDVKTYALSALLINPELPVEGLIKSFFEQKYPMFAQTLYRYYSNLESHLPKNKPLSLYAGIQEAEKNYLNSADFCKFYDELVISVDKARDTERKKLNELQTALSFTRLELSRIHPWGIYGYAERKGSKLTIRREVREWLARLAEYKAFPSMNYYNESGDKIERYMQEWEQYLLSADSSENLLLGIKPSTKSKLDEGYTNLSILTDGARGLPGGYHFGWLIMSALEPTLDVAVKNIRANGTLCLSFLHMPRHRIYAPQQVEVYKDGLLYKTIKVRAASASTDPRGGKAIKVDIPIELRDTQRLSIKVVQSSNERSQIGIDEIAFIP